MWWEIWVDAGMDDGENLNAIVRKEYPGSCGITAVHDVLVDMDTMNTLRWYKQASSNKTHEKQTLSIVL